MTEQAEIHTYPAGEPSGVAVVMRHCSIIEYDGDLCPGLLLSPDAARVFANDLIQLANEAED